MAGKLGNQGSKQLISPQLEYLTMCMIGHHVSVRTKSRLINGVLKEASLDKDYGLLVTVSDEVVDNKNVLIWLKDIVSISAKNVSTVLNVDGLSEKNEDDKFKSDATDRSEQQVADEQGPEEQSGENLNDMNAVSYPLSTLPIMRLGQPDNNFQRLTYNYLNEAPQYIHLQALPSNIHLQAVPSNNAPLPNLAPQYYNPPIVPNPYAQWQSPAPQYSYFQRVLLNYHDGTRWIHIPPVALFFHHGNRMCMIPFVGGVQVLHPQGQPVHFYDGQAWQYAAGPLCYYDARFNLRTLPCVRGQQIIELVRLPYYCAVQVPQ